MPRLLDRPVFIVGCNRSGTTALFRNLSAHPDAWSRYGENTELYREFFPAWTNRGDRVEPPVTREVAERLERALYEEAHNKQFFVRGRRSLLPTKLVQRPLRHVLKRAPVRLFDKTPENSFRVELLARLFPDSRFLFVVRDGKATVSSLMEGWRHWGGVDEADTWHYLRPPGWLEIRDRPLHRKCLFQWLKSNEYALSGLRTVDSDRVYVVSYRQLYRQPEPTHERLQLFCGLSASRYWETNVVSRVSERIFTSGGTEPAEEKWRRKNEEAILDLREPIESMNDELVGALTYSR